MGFLEKVFPKASPEASSPAGPAPPGAVPPGAGGVPPGAVPPGAVLGPPAPDGQPTAQLRALGGNGSVPGATAAPYAAPGGPAPAAHPQTTPLGPGGGAEVAPADLLERRRALAERLAELQWDLGGLTYEMAIRDHFRLDVLLRRAADLQQVDAQLGELEMLLRLESAGAAGTCTNCGALHPRGAVYCWQCGTQLLGTITPPGAQPPPAP